MEKLRSYLQTLSVSDEIAADAVDKFRIYRDFLREQNSLFNLTAITDPEEIEIKHFIDSLLAYPRISREAWRISERARVFPVWR